MREAHRPRGNPLFDDLDAAADAGSDVGSDTSDEWGETSGASEARFSRSGRTRTPPPSSVAVNPLVESLMEAGPETAEHLLRAMEELLLAARTVVQAAERGVSDQGGGDRKRGVGDERRTDPDSDSVGSDDSCVDSKVDSDARSRGGSASGGFSSIDLD